jgi:hypothetical protein
MTLPTLSPVARILWIVLVILVAGYLLGRWLNRRRSKAVGEWIQSGLKIFGTESNWRFPGGMSSGAEVKITNANAPFREVEIAYYLVTREFPFLWGIEFLRGKRDLLAIRADLRGAVSQEFEVVPLDGPLRRALDAREDSREWQWVGMPAGLGMSLRSPVQLNRRERMRVFLDAYGPSIQRLSLRERGPNLVLFAHLPEIEKAPAREFFQAVRRLLDQAEGTKR